MRCSLSLLQAEAGDKSGHVSWIFLVPTKENGLPIEEPSGEITNLLRAWSGGDHAALDRLAGQVYPELRRMARRYMKNERQANTLQSTALVHEVYLRLVDVRKVDWRERAQFYAMAAQMMRRILVDAARARAAKKRGGSSNARIDRSGAGDNTAVSSMFTVAAEPPRFCEPRARAASTRMRRIICAAMA